MRQVLVSDAFITNCESSTWILRKYVGKGNWITFAVSSSTIVLWGICPGRKYFHIFIFKSAMSKAPKLIIKDWTFLYLWWNERGCLYFHGLKFCCSSGYIAKNRCSVNLKTYLHEAHLGRKDIFTRSFQAYLGQRQWLSNAFQNRCFQKIFAILTGKHLCWRLFIIKLQVFRSATLLKDLQHF